MILGTGLLLAAGGIGWVLARNRSLLLVRAVNWWVTRVVVWVVESSSWARRAAAIFVNNTCVLAAVVALGHWRNAGLIGVAILGFDLGIAVRLLGSRADDFASPWEPRNPRARRRIVIGGFLNLLEPPAIVIALGMAVGQGTIPLAPSEVWAAFAKWIVPALLVAAGGEALWLGATRQNDVPPEPLLPRLPDGGVSLGPPDESAG